MANKINLYLNYYSSIKYLSFRVDYDKLDSSPDAPYEFIEIYHFTFEKGKRFVFFEIKNKIKFIVWVGRGEKLNYELDPPF